MGKSNPSDSVGEHDHETAPSHDDHDHDDHDHHHQENHQLNHQGHHHHHDALPTGYPWAEFCVVFGFLFVFLTEQIVLYFHSRRHAHDRNRVARPQVGCGNRTENVGLVVKTASCGRTDDDIEGANVAGRLEGSVVDGDSTETPRGSKSVMRAIILMLALCFHSIFEGIAIGLMSKKEDALTLFTGVCMHKGIEAFCLGLNISQSGIRPFLVVVIDVSFAIMTPLGILIGMAVMGAPQTSVWCAFTAVLQGIATGTLLYCVFIEILPKELLKDEMVAHDHNHFDVVLEDVLNLGGLSTSTEDKKPTASHAHTSSHNNSEQAFKLIKCVVFAVGFAAMAGAVAFHTHSHA